MINKTFMSSSKSSNNSTLTETKYGNITKKTLDATHQDILENFKNRKKDLPRLRSKIEIIIKNETDLKDKLKILKNPIEKMVISKKLWGLEDSKKELIDEMNKIEKNDDEIDYLLDTNHIIKEYYKSKNKKGIRKIEESPKTQPKKNKKKSILDWISKQPDNKDETEEIEELDETDETDEDYILNIKKSKKSRCENMGRQQLYEKYMNLINENYINEDAESSEEELDICESCGDEMLLEQNTGTIICMNCGYQEQVLIDSDKPSYKDPPKEITSFCYKRINHLNECLAQFQGKETTDIPEEIYNEILVEIKKERIKNMADITPGKLRLILKKLNRAGYYEHVPYIINQLNGLPPPVISPEVEEIIRNLFKEIQEPFERHRDEAFTLKKRKNFISYSYVVYKLFELLELDDYLDRFQQLKSSSKKYQQDILWKKICEEVKWQFIPST